MISDFTKGEDSAWREEYNEERPHSGFGVPDARGICTRTGPQAGETGETKSSLQATRGRMPDPTP